MRDLGTSFWGTIFVQRKPEGGGEGRGIGPCIDLEKETTQNFFFKVLVVR